MYLFCPSTTVYRGFPDTSLSESALQDTESSEMLNIVQTSKSIYDQPSSDTSGFMKYLAKRVQIKTGFPVVHREFVDQSQSESSLHTNDSLREIKPVRASKSSYDEPSNLSHAAMRWIATRELLKTGFPLAYTDHVKQSQSESYLKFKDPSKLVKSVRTSKSIYDVPSSDSQEFVRILSKRAQGKTEPTKKPKESKAFRPVCDLCSTAGGNEIKHEVVDNSLSEKTKKRDRTTTPPSDEQLDLKRPKLETLSDEELIKEEIPCIPFVNACLKRELAHDKKKHHNLRKIKEWNAAPSTSRHPLIQPDIITSTRPAWFANQFAEDDEDLDAEVAMIMDKGEQPTVCPYRLMPEYYVPRLVQERQIKELEGAPFMRLKDGSIVPFTRKWFRREPNAEAIKILNPWPCLHRNKIFGELVKIGSIQVEDSPAFWRRPETEANATF